MFILFLLKMYVDFVFQKDSLKYKSHKVIY